MALEALNSPSSLLHTDPHDDIITLHSLKPTPSKRPRFENSPSEEEYLALCLLMLAKDTTTTATAAYVDRAKNHGDRFKCKVCKKSFSSYQALGGHKASHHRNQSVLTSSSSSIAAAVTASRITTSSVSLSGRKHECSICHRTFLSGQALGGHKRRHFDGGSGSHGDGEDNKGFEGYVNLSSTATSQLDLDLNLPAVPDF